MKATATDIKFKRGKKNYAFTIIHNLPTQFGLNIECALDNWLARTEEFTAESLCEYIESKETGFFAYTEEFYLKAINNETKSH